MENKTYKDKEKEKQKNKGGFALGTNGFGMDLGNGLVLGPSGIGVKLGDF